MRKSFGLHGGTIKEGSGTLVTKLVCWKRSVVE